MEPRLSRKKTKKERQAESSQVERAYTYDTGTAHIILHVRAYIIQIRDPIRCQSRTHSTIQLSRARSFRACMHNAHTAHTSRHYTRAIISYACVAHRERKRERRSLLYVPLAPSPFLRRVILSSFTFER